MLKCDEKDGARAEPAETTLEPGGETGVKGSYHGVKRALKGTYW